jgi:preprotein translocase subunit SecF
LYDTVVVYDKVQENTKGLTSLTRRTYPEAANLAINQTLMRSINTSLIALLPVAGLLVAGVVILGSGTLKDLSLVMLIGMLIGAYSSVFLAVPVAVDLKLRDPLIKAHTARVLAKRKAEGLVVDADGDPIGRVPGVSPPSKKQRAGRTGGAASSAAASSGVVTATPSTPVQPLATSTLTPGAAPKPGAKPVRPRGGSRGGSSGGPAGGKGRPTGKRGR